MIDTQTIKAQLTEDNIIELLDSLGSPLMKADSNNLVFPSVCHQSDPLAHSPKLWLYLDSMKFKCWSCGFAGDVISLVQHVKHIDFNQAVAYICSVLHLTVKEIEQKDDVDNWGELRRYLPGADIDEEQPIKQYDPHVLLLFERLYPQEWLDYGITADIMNKFGIGWYARQACISIPVMFNGQLVGVRGRYTRQKDIEKGKYRPITTLSGETLKFPSSQIMYGYNQNMTAIKQSRQAVLFESEKSVLKAPAYGVNNSLAVFGSNISKRHIQLLLELGVNEVVLAMDSDYHIVGDDEFKFFVAKMKKLISKIRPYFSCSVIYNNQGYDGYKFSPVDFTQEQFNKLWTSRAIIS